MGTELEIKYAVDDLQLLDCMLCDPMITQKMTERYRFISMKTTYFDTEDRQLREKHWTLRLRQENDETVITCKTPGAGRERGEWEVRCDVLEDALPMLAELGAPQELKTLDVQTLVAVCGAEFRRIAADLTFSDGSRCELAGDIGELTRCGRRLPICELELERKEGSEQAMLELGRALQAKYGIREEPMSKYARASRL